MQRPFFAILGGMGTLATESYLHTLNQKTHAHTDQDYLDYIVFNDASVPDRTAYILDHTCANPFIPLADDIKKATTLGASFIVLTCNTAHYFYDDFQNLTDLPILHMPRIAIARARKLYPPLSHPRIGFLGTCGSRVSGVYEREIKACGYEFVLPDDSLQSRITSLIYDDVKGTGELHEDKYLEVLHTFLDTSGAYSCDCVVLGCTELSVLAEAFPQPSLRIIDAQALLVDETIVRARALRESN